MTAHEDEMALRIWNSLPSYLDRPSDNLLAIEFARRYRAELARGQKPVAEVDSAFQVIFIADGAHTICPGDKLYAAPVAKPDCVMAPREPTEAQWSGLARDIIMWLDMDNRRTPESLFDHLQRCGRDIPQWLRDEAEMSNPHHAISKGTRAVIIYKAMLAASTTEGK